MGDSILKNTLTVRDETLLPVALCCLTRSRSDAPYLVVTPDNDGAEKLAAAFENYRRILGDARPVVPVPEVSDNRRQWMPENEASRCAALDSALNHVPGFYFAGVRVLLSEVLSPAQFRKDSLSLKIGDEFPPEILVRKLVELDYDNEVEVTSPGEFSWRGGIIDVYSPLYDAPVRIEFFGNEIDGMRMFHPEDQRSFEKVESVRIVPRGTAMLEGEEAATTPVIEFFRPGMKMILCNPARIVAQLEEYGTEGEIQQWKRQLEDGEDLVSLLSDVDEVAAAKDGEELVVNSLDGVLTGNLPDAGDGALLWHWQLLKDSLLRWKQAKYRMVACCAGDGEIERLQEMLAADDATAKLKMEFSRCELNCGIMIPDEKLLLLSDSELFGHRNVRRLVRNVDYKYEKNLRDAMDLEEGVLAVHLNYGICVYHGLKTTCIGGEEVETIELEFADDARIYVPLEEAGLVSRYVGGSKVRPELSRPGGVAWQHSKERAAEAAWGLAAELLRIEAMRQASKGIQFKPSVEWERSFAGSFPFTTTRDQQEAIDACLRDMESDKPMDRLLCGDVGYGKTEVALRAAFRAVMNGHQVAMLVPTTVLAQQHYQTFVERMAEYPVNIEMLSRFRSAGEQRKTLERLAAGEVDIVIGTHRLLQGDVKFASLGLLIIDEEQRFGVKHKQKLKELRASLDILTMTATPIPRTLYMSLSGIRNLSTIMTAPSNRLPVQTIVAYHDKELIKQAIMRELERKGQVFFLYNRVGSIYEMADLLKELVPQARFGVGHGQMTPLELEKVMTHFVSGKYDVLVSTTIIESGIDIPNANTIIIDRADRFGLSELYQLRGRVGRDVRQGYAYLLLPPMGMLPDNARRRIAAIKRYTHLGAGFKLAMKDLEIRGAGNILGEEQSGHIAAVGFDLYCSLLHDAVAKLEHRETPARQTMPVSIDFLCSSIAPVPGKVQAVISPDYIEDPVVRIDCYKRIDALEGDAAVADFRKEMTDRFGKLPSAFENLLELQKIKILARSRKVIRLNVENGRVIIETLGGLHKINRAVPVLSGKPGREQLKQIQQMISAM